MSRRSPSARPVQELVGFGRLALDAGESRRVTFDVSATRPAYHDRHGNLAVEAGDYELRVARGADAIVETETLTVTETTAVPHSGRRYFTETGVGED